MEIEVQLTGSPIAGKISPPTSGGAAGAWVEFRGVVRGEENGTTISALEYEAYPEMAGREIRRILEMLAVQYPCLAAKVIHRTGIIPVGDTAIYVGVAAAHRAEAIALLAGFMDRLKQDVPIWKRQARSAGSSASSSAGRPEPAKAGTPNQTALLSLDEAVGEIRSRCRPLPSVRVALAEAFGRVLRETVCATEDWPDADRSTRDGYAMLAGDPAESYQIVDTLHAADWRPRQLQPGETVRVATGATLPCGGLRVVMQEQVERAGDRIRVVKPDTAANVRLRGEEVKAGQAVLPAGARLSAGALALLAAAGCGQPLVSPRLRVAHFTTGDEIVRPDQTPQPGQIRDSNSILIRGLLQQFPCDVEQGHLPENFAAAKLLIGNRQPAIRNTDLLLVSGGASVGEKDFTRPLLEWLGYEIVFSQVNLRPGRPLIFGVHGPQVAFGLPGNPLSHFVCFHLFVAAALARLAGEEPSPFLPARLAARLNDAACPRETLWPALLDPAGLHPLNWASSGDLTCLAQTNALIRVPANLDSLAAGAMVDFLPAPAMLNA